jgi:hypothetical protein
LRQGVKSNKEKTKELAVQATRWLDTIVKDLKELKANHRELEGLRPNMEEIFECVSPLIDAYTYPKLVHSALITIVKFAEHMKARGTLKRTIRKAKDEEKLSTLRSTLEGAFERFKVRVSPHKLCLPSARVIIIRWSRTFA